MASGVVCTLNRMYVCESPATTADPPQYSDPWFFPQVRVKERYQLQLGLPGGATVLIDDVSSPEFAAACEVPAELMTVPSDAEEWVSSFIFSNFNADERTCGVLASMMAALAAAVTERHGVMGFAVVAEVEMIKVEVASEEEFRSFLSKNGGGALSLEQNQDLTVFDLSFDYAVEENPDNF